MKLNKFLTFLTPVTIIGTITPTIVSCSCSKKTYVYNYKDHINCLNKKYGDYRKLSTIQKAAKIRTQKHPAGSVQLIDINNIWNNEESSGQFAFNELIASATVVAKQKINLNTWVWTANGNNSFKFGDEECSDITFNYKKGDGDDNKIYVTLNNDKFKYRSYVYNDCWID